jgi:hypothetical protein
MGSSVSPDAHIHLLRHRFPQAKRSRKLRLMIIPRFISFPRTTYAADPHTPQVNTAAAYTVATSATTVATEFFGRTLRISSLIFSSFLFSASIPLPLSL